MEIVAGTEAIGELLEQGDVELPARAARRRGMDDLYIPSIAISKVAPKHVYLTVAVPDLLGQAWRVFPGR